MKIKYQSLTGMHDVLPADQVYFKKIQKTVESVVNYYSFEKIETPILEDAEVFAKQFAPVFKALDFVNIENYNCYLKILAGGVPVSGISIRNAT